MKRFILYINIIVLLLSTGCSQKDELEPETLGNGNVAFSFSVRDDIRSKSAPLQFETAVTHLDIFFFDASQTPTKDRIYKRVDVSRGGETHTVPGLKVSELKETTWNVYVVANSNKTYEDFNAITTVLGLKSAVEETEYVYITGTDFKNPGTDTYISPQTFLMTGETTIDTIPESGDMEFNVILTRAAAKITINFIRQTSEPVFKSFGMPMASGSRLGDYENIDLNEEYTYSFEHSSYYLRNLPYTNRMWREAGDNFIPGKRKTNPITNAGHMSCTVDEITVQAYVYPCSWGGDGSGSAFENAPFLIVNLPAVQIDNEKGIYLERNYYEIPLRTTNGTNATTIESNHHYVLNATVNAPGGLTAMEPVPLVPVNLEVYPWNDASIEVGSGATGSTSDVKYLNLSTSSVEMKNVASAIDAIKFASSTPLKSITLYEAYYIDKMGIKQSIMSDSNFPTKATATFTKDQLNGTISISAPFPAQEINAAVYMTFTVINEDNISKTFTAVQYPLLYINNTLGWFSYREDVKNSSDVITHLLKGPDTNQGNYNTHHDDGFDFRVSGNMNATDGSASIYEYRSTWSLFAQRLYGWYLSFWGTLGRSNARMYHIVVSATSDNYVLGKPQLDNGGCTINSTANAKTVSPSFMVASQLGTLDSKSSYTEENYNKAKAHCQNYVETYIKDRNGNIKTTYDEEAGDVVVELDDWRLPTVAEIEIIKIYQTTSPAMDDLLIGHYYFCITGNENKLLEVYTSNWLNDGYWTRCVRDAYDDKTPNKK